MWEYLFITFKTYMKPDEIEFYVSIIEPKCEFHLTLIQFHQSKIKFHATSIEFHIVKI